jgi:hypothetical protein
VEIQLVDGEYAVNGQGFWTLVRAVKPEGVTLGDYERALESIRRGQAAGATPDEIATGVAAEVPVFQQWREWVHAYPDRALALLGILLAVASLAVGAAQLVVGVASYLGDEQERSDPAAPPAPPITINVTQLNASPQLSDEQVAETKRCCGSATSR